MNLIIDTNILISSLLKDSITREILLNESFNFFIPEIVLSEVHKYLSYIVKKSKLSEEEIKEILNSILENIISVPINEYEEKIDDGFAIMGDIDGKDSQFIALALSFKNDGIWSNDKHFQKQEKIPIYKTVDIIKYIENQNETNS
jgi:predicted nucleic acid-binding protein